MSVPLMSLAQCVQSEPSLEEVKRRFRPLGGDGQIILTFDQDNAIAYLRIANEAKKNCIHGKMMVELSEAVDKLEKWETGKGLIFYSNGDTFSSGADLNFARSLTNPNDGRWMACLMHDTLTRLRNLPLVSVSVVQGKALGGGGELALSTDFRLFTPDTQMAFVQPLMGITTGWGGGPFLKSIVGRSRALDFLLMGHKICPSEALSLGLAIHVVQNTETRMAEAVTWLQQRIQYHRTSVVRANKLNIAGDGFPDERKVFGFLWGGEAQREKFNQNIKHK